MISESRFLLSLLATLSVEIPVLVLLQKYIFRLKNIITIKMIIAGLIASVLTLPYLWFVLPPYIDARYYLYVGELAVIAVEGGILKVLLGIKLRTAISMSAIANICSFGMGLVVGSL